MPVSPRLDTTGGSNFENYPVRNVASLSTGQAALATAPYDAEHQRVKINTELNLLGVSIAEYIQDTVAALIIAGANITKTYDDAANTLTIASTGGSTNSVDNILASQVFS
jgi:hypothetical protein